MWFAYLLISTYIFAVFSAQADEQTEAVYRINPDWVGDDIGSSCLL
jgi:hypothetical protein